MSDIRYVSYDDLPVERQKEFFYTICNRTETERIFNVQNTDDYLLKLRAETVIDHMRLLRVMLKRKRVAGDAWNFSQQFSTQEFNAVLSLLPEKEREKCSKITAGFVFSNEPDGACMRTNYGDVITVSEALRYFIFFMSLCFVDFDYQIPFDVRQASMVIGIRTMLKTEALDFELDPRGRIPHKVETLNNWGTNYVLLFTIAHEYAHHILGHLDKKQLYQRPLYLKFHGEPEEPPYTFYNRHQAQEFEADLWALTQLNIPEENRKDLALSALILFAYLDVYYVVHNYLYPPSPYAFKTHPAPLRRIENIFDNLDFIDRKEVATLLQSIEIKKKDLEKNIGYNVDLYEKYGSVYLSRWKERMLIDRVDY